MPTSLNLRFIFTEMDSQRTGSQVPISHFECQLTIQWCSLEIYRDETPHNNANTRRLTEKLTCSVAFMVK